MTQQELNTFYLVYGFISSDGKFLRSEGTKEFETEAAAEEWIATKGYKNQYYVIQKVYRRK